MEQLELRDEERNFPRMSFRTEYRPDAPRWGKGDIATLSIAIRYEIYKVCHSASGHGMTACWFYNRHLYQ